jgi:hypothetical protein
MTWKDSMIGWLLRFFWPPLLLLALGGCGLFGSQAPPHNALNDIAVSGASTESYIDASQKGLVILKRYVTAAGQALYSLIYQTMDEAKAQAGTTMVHLEIARRERQSLLDAVATEKARADRLYWSIPQKVWRFITRSLWFIGGLLLLGVICNVIGARWVGTWIGTIFTWLAKSVSALLTAGVSAVWSFLRWLVDWIVDAFKAKKLSRGVQA